MSPLKVGFENLPRNEQIYMMSRWGMTKVEIAEQFFLSRQRIGDILKKMAASKGEKDA